MQFATFSEFYAYYLTQHANRTSRRLHVIGTGCVIALVVVAVATLNPWWLLLAPVGLALGLVAVAVLVHDPRTRTPRASGK